MNCIYKAFLVKGGQLQPPIPNTMGVQKITNSAKRWTFSFIPNFRRRREKKVTCCSHHCNTRAAQSIAGHHRPVFAPNFHLLFVNCPSKKCLEARFDPHPRICLKRKSKQPRALPVINKWLDTNKVFPQRRTPCERVGKKASKTSSVCEQKFIEHKAEAQSRHLQEIQDRSPLVPRNNFSPHYLISGRLAR